MSHSQPAGRKAVFKSAPWVIAGLVGLVVWFALFARSGEYGFYEDDYNLVVPYLDAPASDILYYNWKVWTDWPQGRPLNHCLPLTIGWIGYGFGGIRGIYLIVFAILCLNVWLVSLVMRRMLGLYEGVLAGLLFIWFPADSTRLFIVHAAHLQLSLSFSLLGSWFLLRRGGMRAVAAYGIAALSLVAYESAFLLFIFLAPAAWFAESSLRAAWKRIVVHWGLCLALLGGVFWWRKHMAEDRVDKIFSDPVLVLEKVVLSPVYGMWTSFRSLLSGWMSLEGASFAVLGGMVLGALLAGGLLTWVICRETAAGTDAASPRRHQRAALAGLLLWAVSYCFTFIHYPPTYLTGRLTSVHLGASVGVAFLGAALAGWLISGLANARLRVAVGGAILSLATFGVLANGWRQSTDFSVAWNAQRTFWQKVMALVPDLREGDTLIVTGPFPFNGRAILGNSFADADVLSRAYRWPDPEKAPTLLWPALVESNDGVFNPKNWHEWKEGALYIRPKSYDFASAPYDPDKMVFLEYHDGLLKRSDRMTLPDGLVLQGRKLTGGQQPHDGEYFRRPLAGELGL